MSSSVIVLGSSGNVGSALIKFPRLSVLAGVRDPASSKAAALKASSKVTLVAADLSKPDTLAQAIPTGIDAVFVNTPGDIDRTQLAINGITAAKAAKAKHVVVVSVLSADVTGSTFGDQFSPIEAAVKASGVPYTLLRLPLFIDNNWANLDSIKNQGKIYGPAKPDAKFTPVAVADIAQAAAAVLASPGPHANKTYRLTAPALSHTELAAAFTTATGKQVDYVHVPYVAAKQAFLALGFPGWQVDGILQLYRHIDAGASYYTFSGDYQAITGKAPTTIQQWTQQVGAAFK